MDTALDQTNPKPRRRRLRWAIAAVFALMAGLWGLYMASPNSMGKLFSAVFSDAGADVERDLAYGPHGRHRLDVYRPEAGDETGPIALFIYGGGWRAGERSTYGFVGAALASRGITTVIPDYRVYPEVMFPAFIEDAADAYRWIVANVPNAAQRPIVLIGHSAGAHTAALLAVDPGYLEREGESMPRPAGFVGLAGPYSFDPTTFETTKDIFASAEDASRTRPRELVTPSAPPALVAHGLDDETVRLWNTRTFTEAMQQAGVPIRKLELEGIGHVGIVLSLSWPFRWRAPLFEEVVGFIETRSIGQ